MALRIGVTAQPPYLMPCVLTSGKLVRSKECPAIGYSAEVLGHILALLQINYTLVKLNKGIPFGQKIRIGKENNGTTDSNCCTGTDYDWTGLLGHVYHGHVDTVAKPALYTKERSEDFDYAYPYQYSQNCFVFLRTSKQSSDLLNILPYRIWMAFIITMLVAFFAYILGQFILIKVKIQAKLPTHQKSTIHRLADSVWTVMTVMTDQYHEIYGQVDHVSSRIILSLFGLLAVFFFALYDSTLLSSLLAQKDIVAFRGTGELAELIKHSNYKMVDMGVTPYYYDNVQNSPVSAFKKMKDAVLYLDQTGVWQKNKNVLHFEWKQVQELLDLMHSDSRFVMAMDNHGSLRITEQFCHLTYVEDQDFPSTMTSFIFKKGNPIVPRFSEHLKRSQQLTDHMLIFDFGRKQRETSRKNCLEEREKRKKEPGTPLGLKTMKDVFVILGVGLLISTLIFLMEFFSQ